MICDNREVRVETDACQYMTGMLIPQEQEEAYRPITYSSKLFNDIKQNYPTHDCKLYATIRALKEWHHYLVRRRFKIWTNHKNLEWFMAK